MGFSDLNNAQVVDGATKVTIEGPTTGFGEMQVAENSVQAQGDFVYNTINDQVFISSSFAGGTVSFANGMCELNSGTDPSGSATIQTRRGLKYRPGQGSLMRATALFDTPDAGNAQFLGLGTAESGYFIGYFGTNFGILHSETGQREIRKLTITTGAGTGNVTVTLDSDSIVVPVTGASKPEQTAYQLAKADYSQVGKGGWLASAISSSVYFISARSNDTSTGSYSVSGASIVGSFSQTKAGENQTNTFTPSASFNVDTLDGLGPSRMTLDPQKGNVYQVEYQYLGFGNAFFSVEDPETGKFTPVHMIKNANNRTTPVLKNPNASILVTSANIGGTTSKTAKTVSMASFVQGTIKELDPKYSKSFTISAFTSTTLFRPLALIKCNRVYNDESCFGEVDLTRLSVANETNGKTLEVAFLRGVSVNGFINFQYVDEANSIASFATLDPTSGGNTFVNAASLVPFYSIVSVGGTSYVENLTPYSHVVQAGSFIAIGVRGDQVSGRITLSWFEQQ